METRSIVDRIRVASPCHARWEDMNGDERARFCGQCQKHVYNFSAMTRAEVEALVQEKEGGLCGRYFQRADGRMLTADCPTGITRRRSRLARFARALCATFLFFIGGRAVLRSEETNKSGTVSAKQPNGTSTNRPPQEVKGFVAVPPPNPRTNEVPGKTLITPQSQVSTNRAFFMGRICIPEKSTPAPPATPATQTVKPK